MSAARNLEPSTKEGTVRSNPASILVLCTSKSSADQLIAAFRQSASGDSIAYLKKMHLLLELRYGRADRKGTQPPTSMRVIA